MAGIYGQVIDRGRWLRPVYIGLLAEYVSAAAMARLAAELQSGR